MEAPSAPAAPLAKGAPSVKVDLLSVPVALLPLDKVAVPVPQQAL